METIYFDGDILDDEDLGDLSEQYGVPYDTVQEVVNCWRLKAEFSLASYSGLLKTRIQQFMELLSYEPRAIEIDPNAPEIITFDDENILLKDVDVNQNTQIAAILQVVTDPIAGHFLIHEGGQVSINQESPPTLPQAYSALRSVLHAKAVTNQVDDYSTWLLGSMVAELETYFGNDFDAAQVAENTTKSYNTIQTACQVYKAFKGKQYKLSYTHHKEAYFTKIDEKDKHVILKKAEAYGLTTKQIRELASYCKVHGSESIKLIKNESQAADLIAAFKENLGEYIVSQNNLWTRIKTTTTIPPEGDIVINLKKNTVKIGEMELQINARSSSKSSSTSES